MKRRPTVCATRPRAVRERATNATTASGLITYDARPTVWVFTKRTYQYMWLDLSPFTGDVFPHQPRSHKIDAPRRGPRPGPPAARHQSPPSRVWPAGVMG